MRLSRLGELALLGELERRGLATGMSDEGAVLADGHVVTHDLLVEGVHFRFEWASWRDAGYKAAAVNLSDLAAMGAEPLGLVVGLAVPGDVDGDDLVDLYEGLNETGVPVIGGDTTAADRVVLAVTAVGRSARVPGRAGAAPGDALVVTGPLGGAAAGLYALEHRLEGFDALVRRQLRPPVRLEAGRTLAAVAHALMDVSDGLVRDAGRIAARSGCRLVVDAERVPLAPGVDEVAHLPFWTMGEDYELLAALRPDDARASGFPVVGWCEEGSGVDVRGLREPADENGWDAFAG